MSKKRTSLWVTAKGEEVYVEDMTNTHLINSIRMLRRKHKEKLIKYRAGVAVSPPGEVAGILALVAEWETMLSDHPQYEELMEEARRRKLAVDPPVKSAPVAQSRVIHLAE
jgi:hypothetical protein